MAHRILGALNWLHSSCNQWCLHFSEVVGIWFTGWATLFAVLVSLYLARRQDARIRVSTRISQVPNAPPRLEKGLAITVVNVGGRSATVNSIAWRPRPWSRRVIHQRFEVPRTIRPPAPVEPGDSRTFIVPLNGRFDWSNLAATLLGKRPWISVHLVRVLAYTSTGKKAGAFLNPAVKNWLIERAATVSRSRSA